MSDEHDPRLALDPSLRLGDVVAPRLVAISLAHELGESEPEPRAQLELLAAVIGVARCVRLLEQTMCVQDKGGLLAPDGTRQRTLGGIFFWLARGSVTYAERRRLFPPPPQTEAATDLGWWHSSTEMSTLTMELRSHAGRTHSMKLTLIGRPSGVTVRTSTVVFILEGGRPPTLPKGVPTPGPPPSCLVVVGRKQWEHVSTALEDGEDSLIIEGYPTLDPRFEGGLTVYATRLITKAQMARTRAPRPVPVTRVP